MKVRDVETSLDELQLCNTLGSNAAEALYMMDSQGRVNFMNAAAERMFGWSRADLLGRLLHDAVHYRRPGGEAFHWADCPLARVMRGGETLANHEDMFIHRDGSWVPVFCSNAPVIADGKITGAVVVVHDLRERRRIEGMLRRRAEELAEADRRKDEFLAMLAHELRNPLAAVANAVHVLRGSERNVEAQRRALAVMERQVHHQSRLIDDLLDISRITRGRITLRREQLDLVRLVVQAAEDHRRAIEAAGLSLTVETPASPLWVSADATRLSQVVGNLLNNASKFNGPRGQVALSVTRDDARELAIVAVRDTGVGIPREMQLRIFEPFTQLNQSLHRGTGGLGLGLALVKSLVELHGGSVEVRSEVGRGSEFRVLLMQVEGHAKSALPPLEAAGQRAYRILVIEDNRDAADVLRELLEMLGHAVDVADNGPAGVIAARRFRPDVVICDIGLPGMDGYAVARALRADEVTAGMRLVALSGYGQDEDRLRATAAGFDMHVTKPLDLHDLERLLPS